MMAPDRTETNAAIATLEDRRHDLAEGINSIASQEEWIEEQSQALDKARSRLAQEKRALLEIDAALSLLKAGAR